MFKRMSSGFTYANVAATLALVFAMTGGAYAAGVFKITSTKQISPKVLKALKGANGKNGTTGAQGAAGPTGPAGPAGPVGPSGSAGAGGAKGETGSKGEKGDKGEKGVKGDEGSPWTAGGTLPPGATETGTWTSGKLVGTGESINITTAISFPIPLALPPEFKEDPVLDGTHVHHLTPEEVEKHEGAAASECPGSVIHPLAEEGQLCVYLGGSQPAEAIETSEFKVTKIGVASNVQTVGASSSGATLLINYTGEAPSAQLVGSWAVTGK